MGIRGNSGFINVDKRFSSITSVVKGVIDVKQHFLERTRGYGSFLPALSPTVWYSPESEYITLVGSDVSGWADRSGNNLSLPDPSTTRPIYDTTDTAFGGLPSVYFAGNDFMETGSSSLLDLNGTDGFTTYVVAKILSFPGTTFDGLIGRTNTSTWNQGWGVLYYESTNEWRFFVNGWNSNYATITYGGGWTNFTDLHIFKMVYDKVNITGEIIGTASGSNSSAYTTAVTDPASEGLGLGAFNGTTYDIEAKYGDVLFYNRPLTTSEQTQTENYLKNKYNIN